MKKEITGFCMYYMQPGKNTSIGRLVQEILQAVRPQAPAAGNKGERPGPVAAKAGSKGSESEYDSSGTEASIVTEPTNDFYIC